MSLKLHGLIVPTITPRNNAAIDLASLEKLLTFLITTGVDAIFILGTTGEFQHLTLEEKQQVIICSTRTIDNKVPLLVGVSTKYENEILPLLDLSEKCGVDALVLAPMFRATSPQEQMTALIEYTSLPVILYNNPAIHQNTMLPLAVIEVWAEHPQIIGIKDSAGDWDYFEKLLELKSADFSVFQGKEQMALRSLLSGADGIVAGAANIAPSLLCQLVIQKDENTQALVMAEKSQVKKLTPDSIYGYKQKLVQLGIIESAEMFHPSA